jgi:hypothetical protein
VSWSFSADVSHRLYYKFTLYQDEESTVLAEGSFYGELTGEHEIAADFVGTITLDFMISNHSRVGVLCGGRCASVRVCGLMWNLVVYATRQHSLRSHLSPCVYAPRSSRPRWCKRVWSTNFPIE